LFTCIFAVLLLQKFAAYAICIVVHSTGMRFDRDLDLSRSRDVIGHVTVRLPMAHFL